MAVFVVAGTAFLATGCKSNNEGKIVGKWKIVSAQGLEQTNQQLDQVGGYLFIEFGSDGTLTMGADFKDKEMGETIKKAAAASGEKTSFSWKYKLLSGDGVEFYDLPPELKQQMSGMFGGKDRARTKIKIDGDNMTMTDDDGKSGQLTRVK
jgi:hypothetical protein